MVPSILDTMTGNGRATMDPEDLERCTKLLGVADMFRKVPPNQLSYLASQMTVHTLRRNDVLLKQGEPSDKFFLLESGDVRRKFVDPEDGKAHTVKFLIKASSINSMRILSGEPVFSTVKCTTETCKVYEMAREDFLRSLHARPEITTAIAEALCEELRRGSKTFQTPLLQQQQQQDVNFPAVSIAAGIESYYRSALNAMLNARLTGVKAELFPNMHIQVPVRISYITGFKGLRAFLDTNVDSDLYQYPTAVQLAAAVSPGIIMTPISSVLEASNAGHMNKEAMATRWMRGIVPRCGREVVFGVGLNQLSDYFEERLLPYVSNDLLANAAASLAAGVVSGYLSHVPHNMSTFKLLEPHRSYGDLYRMFVKKSCPPIVDSLVQNWSPNLQTLTRFAFATLFPRGVMIRTTQIVGSFMILNGTINYLKMREHHKIQRALRANPPGAV
jgi:hypothetical protein